MIKFKWILVFSLALFSCLSAVPVLAQGDDLERIGPLSRKVVELYKEGKYDEAIPLAQEALSICEKRLGPDNPDTANILNSLATLYYSKCDFAQAKPLFQKALAIREKVLGPEHPDTANSLINLANLYSSMGDYAQAEPLYQRALAIWEKALGPEHPDTAIILNSLAVLYESTGLYARLRGNFLLTMKNRWITMTATCRNVRFSEKVAIKCLLMAGHKPFTPNQRPFNRPGSGSEGLKLRNRGSCRIIPDTINEPS